MSLSASAQNVNKNTYPAVKEKQTLSAHYEKDSDLPELTKLAANPKSDYLHPESQLVFPYKMNDFERIQIIVYENNPTKFEAVYYSSDNHKNSFTISLYRIETGTEGRLRNEYLKEIRKFGKEEKIDSLPKATPIKFMGPRYTCNGVKGSYDFSEKAHSQLYVYECGTWMMKIKIKAKNLGKEEIAELESKLTQAFDPSKLTALRPLMPKSIVDFERAALADTVMTAAMVGSAFRKLDWATSNVRASERASGFPDLYLNMHIASLKEFLKIQQNKQSLDISPSAKKYFKDLSEINNAKFLPEFIMDQYQKIMFVPEDLTLNFPAYYKWKENKNLTIDLNKKMYTICYRKQ